MIVMSIMVMAMMVLYLAIAVFFAYISIFILIPAPHQFLCIVNGVRQGFRKSIKFCIGNVIGFFLATIAGFLCCSVLQSDTEWIARVLTIVGIAYHLWLAWALYQDTPPQKKWLQPDLSAFYTGFLLHLLNPRYFLHGVFLYSAFESGGLEDSIWILGIAVFWILGIAVLLNSFFWAGCGVILRRWYEKHQKVWDRILLSLFLCSMIFLLFAKVGPWGLIPPD